MPLLVTHSVAMLNLCIEFISLQHCKQTSFYSAHSPVQWVLRGFSLGGMTVTSHSDPQARLTLSLLMLYIYGAPCKARNFNIVYIYIYMDLHLIMLKASLSICCTMFQHRINAQSFPVSQLCVNNLPATKVTLITDAI
jgi:hypothetical protein